MIRATDELDEALQTVIEQNKNKGVLLADISKQFADVKYYTLLYRIRTLAQAGYITLKKGRKALRCYPAGELQ